MQITSRASSMPMPRKTSQCSCCHDLDGNCFVGVVGTILVVLPRGAVVCVCDGRDARGIRGGSSGPFSEGDAIGRWRSVLRGIIWSSVEARVGIEKLLLCLEKTHDTIHHLVEIPTAGWTDPWPGNGEMRSVYLM